MSAPWFDAPNAEAERMVLPRSTLSYLIAAPIGLLLGDALYSFGKGRPLYSGAEFLLVGVSGLVILTLGLGYLAARTKVRVLVPRSLSIEPYRIASDFGRQGWIGPPTREIRFENVREIRKARLLRVPFVIATSAQRSPGAIPAARLFYLTEANVHVLQSAIAARKSGRTSAASR